MATFCIVMIAFCAVISAYAVGVWCYLNFIEHERVSLLDVLIGNGKW